jgi:hypothetical protein
MIFDFNAATNLNYPVANIQYLGNTPSNLYTNRNYRINLVDQQDDNVDNLDDEVISDMEEVAEDFMTWVYNQDEIVYNRQARIVPVKASTANKLVGIEITLTLSTLRPQNPCAIPTK